MFNAIYCNTRGESSAERIKHCMYLEYFRNTCNRLRRESRTLIGDYNEMTSIGGRIEVIAQSLCYVLYNSMAIAIQF